MNNKENIDAYTILKYVLSIIIMLSHVYLSFKNVINFGKFSFLTHGGFGVTCFFILSGFLISMKNDGYNKEISWIGECIEYRNEKIRKLFILHVICSLPAFLLQLFAGGAILGTGISKSDFIITVFMNWWLVQTWIIGNDYSLNGTSWYLATLSALLFVTPPLLFVKSKVNNAILSVLTAGVCLACIYVFGDVYTMLYTHPFFRIWQYLLGIVLYKIIYRWQKKSILLTIAAIVFSLYAYIIMPNGIVNLVDTVASIGLIMALFNYKEAGNKDIIKICNTSSAVFLIHYPIVCIGGYYILQYMGQRILLEYYIVMILLSALSLLLSYIWVNSVQKSDGYKYLLERSKRWF